MRKYKSGSQKRKERWARRVKEKEAFIAENPTPYEHWEDVADDFRAAINDAYEKSRQQGGPMVHYFEHHCKLSVEALAVTLFAVARVGKTGVSYGQMFKCYERCGIGKSRDKVNRALKVLVRFGLIDKLGGFVAGKRGNAYVCLGYRGPVYKTKPKSSAMPRQDDV